jgi:hypothetical protein
MPAFSLAKNCVICLEKLIHGGNYGQNVGASQEQGLPQSSQRI